MADQVVVGVDGSELSVTAARSGLAIVAPDAEIVLATVIDAEDLTLVTGTGFASGAMTPEEFADHNDERRGAAEAVLAEAAQALGIEPTRQEVLEGDAAIALCELAESVGAAAIVVGTHGRGGLKRALLGSVSDHVVRNATCPVIVGRG